MTAAGQTVQLSASVFDQNGSPLSAPVSWESSDAGVVTVSTTGLVTAKADGVSTITARAGAASASVRVIVSLTVVRIAIMPGSSAMDALGQTVQLTATAFDENGNPVADAPVIWSSSDSSVVTVDTDGLVAAVMNGRADIIATSGRARSNIVVTVSQVPARATLTPETAILTDVDETVQLTFSVLDRNGFAVPGIDFTWSSSDPEVAGVESMGRVTARLNGTTQITVVSDELSGSASIEVRITSPHLASLVALYQFTAGPDWLNSAHWLSDMLVDEWHGVTADRMSRVTEIDLTFNYLQKTLPAEIANIGSLRKLVVTDNPFLSGPLQKAMTRLDLDVLHLDGTNMCVPADAAFQDWLRRISDVRATTCKRNRRDWDALVALYNETNGPNWNTNYNWLTNAPLDSWFGVEADGNGRVRLIKLDDNNLEGEIPPEIAQLDGLDWLTMSKNQLAGTVPPELGQMTNLRILWLSENNLTGPVPSEIGDMVGLASLDMGYNQLNGSIPSELGNLHNLTNLGLYDNQLTGNIPPGLGRIAGLELLYLGKNALSGSIPPELGRLARLRLIWLDDNQLTGEIPAELGNLEALNVLFFAKNRLSGSIPAELARLSNLRWFEVADNPDLEGPLPRSFLNLNLEGLKLQKTGVCVPSDDEFVVWLGGILDVDVAYCADPVREALTALYNGTGGQNWLDANNWLNSLSLSDWFGVTVDAEGTVTALNLADNNLNGTLNPSLGILAGLQRLNLSGNPGLSGRVPRSFLDLELDVLDLAGTGLCIPMDQEFRRWLQEIPVSDTSNCTDYHPDREVLVTLYNETNGTRWTRSLNWLSDAPLHAWHGVKTSGNGQVIGLSLTDNRLSGSIPDELGRLSGLTQLSMFNNDLTGPIPPELGQLDELRSLSLSGNNLSGPIPPELGELNNLERLSLGSNRLTGEIPPEFGQLENLRWLSLNSNFLEGSIPPELGRLQKLGNLGLGKNTLTGSIPPELGSLRELNVLSVSWNRLSGSLPRELFDLSNLETLDIRNNRLTGTIPPELGNLNNLSTLLAGHNLFTSSIPPEIGDLVNLHSIDFINNRLSGSIPREIGRLGKLTFFYLQYNRLSGAVPEEMGFLGSLKELKLTANTGLSGPLPLSFTMLNLDVFDMGETGLCAPRNPGFQEWIDLQPFDPIPICP